MRRTAKKLRTSIEVLNFFIQADRLGISSRFSVYIIKCDKSHLYLIIPLGVYSCRLDDIQLLTKLMIYDSCGIDDIQGLRLDFFSGHPHPIVNSDYMWYNQPDK